MLLGGRSRTRGLQAAVFFIGVLGSCVPGLVTTTCGRPLEQLSVDREGALRLLRFDSRHTPPFAGTTSTTHTSARFGGWGKLKSADTGSTRPRDTEGNRGIARSVRKRHPFRLRVRVGLCFRRRWTVEFTVERSCHRGMCSGGRIDLRLRRDEAGRSVLGVPSSMVVVDSSGSHDDSCRSSVLRTRRSFRLGAWIGSAKRRSEVAEVGSPASAQTQRRVLPPY